jgi:hypothetical protein
MGQPRPKRRFAVLVFMQPDAAVVDGWHARPTAVRLLQEYRDDPEWANYFDSMTIVEKAATPPKRKGKA